MKLEHGVGYVCLRKLSLGRDANLRSVQGPTSFNRSQKIGQQ